MTDRPSIDRFFFAVLTFCLLAAGTAAIGSAWFAPEPATPATQVAARAAAGRPVYQLPAVEVIGRRASGPQVAQRASSDPLASRLQ